ncbi:MAG: eCIS core domain-containing protein [Longimicrobiales bacterium]
MGIAHAVNSLQPKSTARRQNSRAFPRSNFDSIQHSPGAEEFTIGHGTQPLVSDVIRSAGRPLDPGTRAFMELRFGHDFSRVRIHSNAHAARSARAPVLQRQSASQAPAPATPSCTRKQRKSIKQAGDQLRKWLKIVFAQLDDFAADPEGKHQVAGLLVRHFGTHDLLHAEAIRYRLQDIRADLLANQAYLRQAECPSDCQGKANVVGSKLPVHYCAEFFGADVAERAAVLLHELTHVDLPAQKVIGTADLAYASQRLYQRLPPTEAMDNADAYGEFVREVATGKTAAFKLKRDDLSACPKGWKPKIRNALAWAQAWAIRTHDQLRDRRPHYVMYWQQLRITYLHPDPEALEPGASVQHNAAPAQDIDRAERAMQLARGILSERLIVRCPVERGTSCGDNPYSGRDTNDRALILCPAWPDLSSAMRTVWALAPLLGGVNREESWRLAEFAREMYTEYEHGRRNDTRKNLGLGPSAQP